MKTIRLIYPQWQGGDIARWVPEITDANAASRGYYLGAQLLDFLVPNSNQETFTVPVSVSPGERTSIDGILDRDDIVRQTQAAMNILDIASPDKIVTLGGECSVSVAPFTYLAKKYDGDVAIVWLDAHPDITLPGDPYAGYHAMAVTACMGIGDEKIINELPYKFDPSKILIAGLRDWERSEIKERQKAYKISYLSPEELCHNSDALIA